MDNMYNKIANLLVSVLPNGWSNVAMYAHIDEDMYEIFFFVKVGGVYYNCYKLDKEFGISRKTVMRCFDKVHEALLDDYRQKKWFCATVQLCNDNKFVIEYTYDVQLENEDSFKTNWKETYLK